MVISQTLDRDLFTERSCGNNVLKSIVCVKYCQEIQLHRRNAKSRKALVPEAKLLENGTDRRRECPEMNEPRKVHFCYELQIGSPLRWLRFGI